MYDVVIVGAGPIGLYTARLLGRELKTLVIDRKREVGVPAQCSGLYSTNLKKFMPIKKEFLQHKVRGAILHSPSGIELKVKKKGNAAFVIDRTGFDKYLASHVKTISLGEAVKSVQICQDSVLIKTGKRRLESKMIIGCDGPNSLVRNHFGHKINETINGIIAIAQERDAGEHVELWFDNNKIQGGFFWRIPRKHTTEYGAFGKNVNFKQLESFFGLKKGYEKRAGTIPFGPPKTYFDRCLLIGDAAAQVKPWSGGGVVYGMTCAKIASRVIKKAFQKQDFSERVLQEYEKEWKKNIGKPIGMGMIFRDFLAIASNKDIDDFFASMKNLKGINGLDMDFPEFGF